MEQRDGDAGNKKKHRNQDISARAAAARAGNAVAGKRRLTERFEVPEAFLVVERRTALVFWRPIGKPCPLADMSIRGVRFEDANRRLRAGDHVRVTLLLPSHLPIRLKGRVAHDGESPDAGTCGIGFTDYGSTAWALLCDIHKQYARSRTLVSEPTTQGRKQQKKNMQRLYTAAIQPSGR